MYGVAMAAVTELTVTILALLYAGKLADERFGTGSRYMSIGAVVGCILGFVRLTLRLKKFMDNTDDKP
jgi:hypothetical protein